MTSHLEAVIELLYRRKMKPEDAEMIRHAVIEDIRTQQDKLLQFILSVTCFYTHVDEINVLNGGRHRSLADTRHIYSYLARKHTDYSLGEIGQVINRDHSSVMHGVNKVENIMQSDKDFRRMVEQIKHAAQL